MKSVPNLMNYRVEATLKLHIVGGFTIKTLRSIYFVKGIF